LETDDVPSPGAIWRAIRAHHYPPPVAPPPPINTTPPTIVGNPTVGTNLIGVQGAWTGAVSFDRFWLRDGVRIPGASGNAYLIVAGDVGSMLGLEIDANGPGGTTRADAAPIGPVAGP
jgi:hypothetical protein